MIVAYPMVDEAVGGKTTIWLEGEFWISTLLGEPVLGCKAKWDFRRWDGEPDISIDGVSLSDVPRRVLRQVTLHSVKLSFETPPLNRAMFAWNQDYDVACDPGAMEEAGGKVSFTTPASYSWDQLFYQSGSYDGRNRDAADFADEATAKQIMIETLEHGVQTGPGQVRVLRARINLRPVFDWLKEEQEKERAPVAAKEEDRVSSEDFWSGAATEEQVEMLGSETSSSDFWAGDTAAERQRREEEARERERQRLAAEEAARRERERLAAEEAARLERERLAAEEEAARRERERQRWLRSLNPFQLEAR